MKFGWLEEYLFFWNGPFSEDIRSFFLGGGKCQGNVNLMKRWLWLKIMGLLRAEATNTERNSFRSVGSGSGVRSLKFQGLCWKIRGVITFAFFLGPYVWPIAIYHFFLFLESVTTKNVICQVPFWSARHHGNYWKYKVQLYTALSKVVENTWHWLPHSHTNFVIPWFFKRPNLRNKSTRWN